MTFMPGSHAAPPAARRLRVASNPTAGTSAHTAHLHAVHPRRRSNRLLQGATEFGLIAALYLIYRAGRLVTAGSEATARLNAVRVHDFEGFLRLPSEAAIQDWVPAIQFFEAANIYYVAVHFPVTIAFLVWGFVARPRQEYVWARNLLAAQTLTAVTIHILFPLAPPRMFSQWGFIDTMQVYGPSPYKGASGAIANQYAAMPSLHVGWAVLIAFVVARTGPPLMRRLTALHAVITAIVVTITAAHWLVDGLAGIALLGLALLVFPRPGVSRWRRLTTAL